MSIFDTVSTVSVRGGLWAVSAVLPKVNRALTSVLYTVSTLSVRAGCGLLRYIPYTRPDL